MRTPLSKEREELVKTTFQLLDSNRNGTLEPKELGKLEFQISPKKITANF